MAWHDDNRAKQDESYECYAYGDNTLVAEYFSGSPIDTAEQFEAVINELIASVSFRALKKYLPFHFIYQEHDSGHIKTVQID